MKTNGTICFDTVCQPCPFPISPSWRCDAHSISLALGPTIRFLSSSIRDLGGDLSSHNIYCRRCDKRQAGSFDPEYGIRICANEMRNQGHLEDTLAHEMVHAYDHLRFKLDWAGGDLRHAACSEVSISINLFLSFNNER